MGYDWALRLAYVSYELVKGTSTRKGPVVFLDDIFREAAAKGLDTVRNDDNLKKCTAETDPERTSLEVGIGAIKIRDMQVLHGGNYVADWDQMTRFEGDMSATVVFSMSRK